MSRERLRRIRETNLRVAAAVADIEGLYTALLATRDPAVRAELLGALALAGRRLARVATVPAAPVTPPLLPRSRRMRRRALAARGADWLAARLTGTDRQGRG
ncbi:MULTISPECIES: hypothetical protein [Streptomycetaceae]|uniref:Uncharacterized protein n=1 Tax=Streptantibioticus cattleyicolor (strain ATCC 35852 / DSM 46488 / JCM 4925 / NBRC 14057 / NRRL 8057) TaxID=1003195 RepID=F8JSP6_STREN|nr:MULTISPECIES: hypothetical protein [Streptomycetaceae]AEW97952.1 hypothetical protein SCATT_55810 [Streptantibioticus cattleyicolor NRRL 8057 = DSM 46488]MYS62356.1 hypothetical protein [Streptomyces sp. SID5468]CCB78270.1 protein of unknown function [Streptantibioticus cattleyicolor NRRL 8057 = DSM 46488]